METVYSEIDSIEETELRTSLEEAFAEADKLSARYDNAIKAVMDLESRSNIDKKLIADGKMSVETYMTSFESYNDVCESIGYREGMLNVNISAEDISDPSISIEELDGYRKTLSDKIYRALEDTWLSILDTGNHISAIIKSLQSYNVKKLNILKRELDNGTRVPIKSKFISANLNKRLSIFYAMGGDANKGAKGIIEHIGLTKELIVKKKFYDMALDYGYDNLVVAASNESNIPSDKVSIDVLDEFKDSDVKDWLSKDIKFGMIDRYIGDMFSVLYIEQNDNGANVGWHYFNVNKDKYLRKEINSFSGKDIEKLLEFGIDLKNDTKDILSTMNKITWKTYFKSIRSYLATIFYNAVFPILSIRRTIRYVYLGNTFVNGLFKNMLMQQKKK